MATIQIYTDDQLKRQVEAAAAAADRSVSYVVRRWIEAGLQQQQKLARKTGQSDKIDTSRQ